jgi:hypothetical protein
MSEPRWRRVRDQFTEVWYCRLEDPVRVDRLVERHVRFGKSPAAAHEWVHRSDEANARLIAATAPLADLVVDVAALPPPDAPGRGAAGRGA